ncbi:tubby-like protein 4 [Miscanthus floridulus]|uniref:tubby-like protein 4 n=1 Tax=Miscanthus floridulus TaxID=154761 RepID=UPI0034585A58
MTWPLNADVAGLARPRRGEWRGNAPAGHSMKDEAAAQAPPAFVVGPRGRELLLPPPSSNHEARDLSDSESAPASSWATLPNRALLCRSLPQDVGRCTCVIVREAATGARGVALYSLCTNEGQGRQDRKLAVARHRRRGRSEFIVAQNQDGIFCTSDNNFLGTVGANLVGSKYQIWGQGSRADELKNQSKRLLGVVAFAPTITMLTGSFRSMRAWIPKDQSMQLKTNNSAQIQHVSGLPKDWQEKKIRVVMVPCASSRQMTKRYELDFRERARRMGCKVQTSVKNFQMTLEPKFHNDKIPIVSLGRVGKSKYIMDFRYPLTGYQAFCICLASIDAKLCCTL